MYSNNQKISNTQIKKLLIFDILSISIMLLPEIASIGAGKDGLISIILGSFVAVIYSLFFLFVVNKIDTNFIDYSKKTIGKFLTFIIGFFYIIKLLFSCWFTITLFSKIINDTLLPDTNVKIIILTLILVSIYAAGKGIEVRARLTEVLFFIVVVPLILLLVLGLKRVEVTNLLPLYTESNHNILNTSYFVLLTYSAVEILLFAVPVSSNQKEKKEITRSVVKSVLFTAVMNILFFILVLGLLGLTGAKQQFKSSIMIMQLIQVPGGFIQRQDALMLTFWMLSIFTLLSAYFYYLTYITKGLITNNSNKDKKKDYYLLFWAVLLFSLSFIKLPIESLFSLYSRYMAYIGLPLSLFFPLLIIIISSLRKGGAYGK